MLAELLAELDEGAARDLDDYGNLHQVRIAGKRLRYAMEVFADCFEERFRTETYPAIEEMQEILGRANDSHVAAHRLRALRDQLQRSQPDAWKRCRPGVESLIKHHCDQLPRERKRFLEWLRRWQQLGQEAQLSEQVHDKMKVKC